MNNYLQLQNTNISKDFTKNNNNNKENIYYAIQFHKVSL